jgi:hypothetical protein
MKSLVTQYHALNIKELARGGWLYPFSKYDWVWRTNKGSHQTTVTITVLKDSLQLLFLTGIHQHVLQDVQLTYSLGPRGGQRTWFRCPTCPRRVGVLYHANDLPFRCRTCCGLAYPSQYQSRDQSYGRQRRMVSYRERDRLSAQLWSGVMMISSAQKPRFTPERHPWPRSQSKALYDDVLNRAKKRSILLDPSALSLRTQA